MRESLLRWIGDADALRHLDRFGVPEVPLSLGYQRTRKDDLYISVVGELFDRMRDHQAVPADWAQIGNALGQFGAEDRREELLSIGVSRKDATLFAAAAFYFGGFPASAYVTMRSISLESFDDVEQACFDILARPSLPSSRLIEALQSALVRSDFSTIDEIQRYVIDSAQSSLAIGPETWIPYRLLQSLLERFRETNLRAILPNGTSEFWTPLVASLVARGRWDFFPSQIEAIQKGLLLQTETFSLQMPTSAGKTALCETLLFYHLNSQPDTAAVLLVPYRSLASELRGTLVRHLNDMGISARCAYGGTVPSGDEVRAFEETRALVATPETLSGILSANADFAKRISLVICDEGHLLDAPSRGVGLELLLARMKVRETGIQRYIFVSAIVPNIEEINVWLGGRDETVVRSDYRPAIAEFAVLRPVGDGNSRPWDLEMHPHEAEPVRYRIERFLRREDFRWFNAETGRWNTYGFSSFSSLAIASARKALPMGAAVVFAANKRGDQGAIGLANQLLRQMRLKLNLPNPMEFGDRGKIEPALDYLAREYGREWVGTQILDVGAIVHHGDIPQETREVLESLLRDGSVCFGICTSTLAEGVNLPIRTLVLYSVQRLGAGGSREELKIRDIKNLVGRAGRAGATTKGLVICVNADQWPLVESVARQAAGEPVFGALRSLIENVRRSLAVNNLVLSNELLERSPRVHSLVDGIDATLIDLAAAELGEAELVRLAVSLADQTFASRQVEDPLKNLLKEVFTLRAQRVSSLHASGRLGWLRETGARARMVDLVEMGLLPLRANWDDVTDPMDRSFVDPLLKWAWSQPELQETVRDGYRVDPEVDVETLREPFFSVARAWLSGASFEQIAEQVSMDVDDLLGVHSSAITFSLQTIIEQGIALLEKLLQSQNRALAPVAMQFPDFLRFGVPSRAACTLASGGVRHRRAFAKLGAAGALSGYGPEERRGIFLAADGLLQRDPETWKRELGELVFRNTVRDLGAVVRRA
jgi:helicase